MPVSNLGRIGFVPKGDWVAGTYKYLDVVKHNQGTWICAVPTTTQAPVAGKHWQNAVSVVGTNLSLGNRTATTVPVNSSTGNNVTLPAATTTQAGVMTSSDKTKLNSAEEGATNIPRITGILTVTVGTGGTYPTISAAIDDLIQRKKTNRYLFTTIKVLSGFVINEQILVRNTDLSWITITSNNNLITSTFTPSTTLGSLFGYGGGFRPVFGVTNGKLPLFYEFNYEADVSNWDQHSVIFGIMGGGYFHAANSRFVGTGSGSSAFRLLHMVSSETKLVETEVRSGGGVPYSVQLLTCSNLTAQSCNFRADGSTTDEANDLTINNRNSFSGNLARLSNCLGGTSITPNIINNGSLVLSD